MDLESALSRLHRDLGHKRLNRAWAKGEIALGLIAAAVGLLLGHWAVLGDPAAVRWLYAAAGMGLMVLGAYLAMAGHRSHLYQSNNALAAYLATRIAEAANPSSFPSESPARPRD